MAHMPNAQAPVTLRRERYDVQNFGVRATASSASAASNRSALNDLIEEAHANGGGTIYFPSGAYRFAMDESNLTISVRGKRNLRFAGEGPTSRLSWDGATTGSAHMFRVDQGSQFITFENLCLLDGEGEKDDPTEQNHLVWLTNATVNAATLTENVEHCKILNCYFGVTAGDAVNCCGGIAATACHSAILASAASGTISGTFTNPISPQRVSVTFQTGWDGGDITIQGTDINNISISETVTAATGTFITAKEFLTVTGATKSAQGAASNTATIGFCYMVQHVEIAGCTFNGFDYSAHGGNLANTNGYRSAIGVQRSTRYIYVVRNFMTGCGDQLIDFEPTGTGELGPWFIDSNVAICANPQVGGAVPVTAFSFWGNDETSGRNTRSRISRNICLGAVSGGKWAQCDITDNIITIVDNTAGKGVSCSGTAIDCLIRGNRIISNATTTISPINITANNSVAARGLRVIENTVDCYNRGIYVEGASDLALRGNRVRYLSATTNTHNAIVVSAHDGASLPIGRTIITDNLIEGAAGGGTFQYGIALLPGGQTNGPLVIRGNVGTGVQTRGIDVPAGTYSSPPIISDNILESPTDQVKLGQGVVIQVGGNGRSGVGQYAGDATDPSTDGELDSVGIGSSYQSRGTGGDLYLKTASGSSGWKKVTHA